jgi:hypothetical protein
MRGDIHEALSDKTLAVNTVQCVTVLITNGTARSLHLTYLLHGAEPFLRS